ncbi:MAG: hypothetical protein ABSF60_08830 [Verrucomicrobiota bacterium]|jgi:hypothetical protein
MRLPVSENGATGVAASLNGSRGGYIFTGCLLLLLLVGWLDYITGYELGFFVFYTVPIGLAAWYLGRWPGIWLALAATIAWWLADALGGAKYSSQFSFWWNSTVHFVAFVINAVTIAKIRLDLRQRDELAAKLEAARQTLRAAAKALPSCPLCGKAHSQTGQNSQAELRDLARGNADLSGALCEECARPARRS